MTTNTATESRKYQARHFCAECGAAVSDGSDGEGGYCEDHPRSAVETTLVSEEALIAGDAAIEGRETEAEEIKATSAEWLASQATITLHDDAERSRVVDFEVGDEPAFDFSVTIETLAGTKIESSITLWRDVDGHYYTGDSPLDGWVANPIVNWLRTLDDGSFRAVVESLRDGEVGVQAITVGYRK